jgi:hypothetical protein
MAKKIKKKQVKKINKHSVKKPARARMIKIGKKAKKAKIAKKPVSKKIKKQAVGAKSKAVKKKIAPRNEINKEEAVLTEGKEKENAINDLISRGRDRGFVTEGEILSAIGDIENHLDSLEDLYKNLRIQILELKRARS